MKHAVKTIVSSLKPDDRLAIVSFSSRASINTTLQSMDKKNKTIALSTLTTIKYVRFFNFRKSFSSEEVEALTPGGSTNLWDGLHSGLELLRKEGFEIIFVGVVFHLLINSGKGRNSAVFLLTDGEPTDIPEGGHIPALQRYKDQVYRY